MSVGAYLPALSTGFTSDDFFILSRLKALDGLASPVTYFQTGFYDYYRPAAFISHAVDWELWGLNAWGFHLHNVLLHGACSILVFLVAARLVTRTSALIAAGLFAVHPASHEAVYWVAARFDLLATLGTLLALLLLSSERTLTRGAGLAAFALALLSKESAIALVVIAPAWDVFVSRRSFAAAARRFVPLLAVVAVYALARSGSAGLDLAGGTHRLPKLVLLVATVAAVFIAARLRERSAPAASARGLSWIAITALTGAVAAALLWPLTSAWVQEKLGFLAFASFYLISPVVFPPPPETWFTPTAPMHAVPGLAIVAVLAVSVGRSWPALTKDTRLAFIGLFLTGSLLPVLSMTGGLRYLYLATAAVTILVGWMIDRVPSRGRLFVAVSLTAVLLISFAQLWQAGRAWKAGSDLTRDGIATMTSALEPCGTRDLLLLTAPVAIGGVYANFYFETFDVLTGCSPRDFTVLLRVVGTDARIDVTEAAPGTLILRIADYRGNVVASPDLRNFTRHILPGESGSMVTPAGRLEFFADGPAQIFRLTLDPRMRGHRLFHYSEGRVTATGG